MGKVPIRLKEVVYTLSPFQQSVMNGLWKDLPHKAAHHMHNVRGSGAGQAGHLRRRRRGRGRRRALPRCLAVACSPKQLELVAAARHRELEQTAARSAGCCCWPLLTTCRCRRSPRPRLPPQMRDFVLFCVAPIAGIAYYCADFKEKEKLHHRCAGCCCRCCRCCRPVVLLAPRAAHRRRCSCTECCICSCGQPVAPPCCCCQPCLQRRLSRPLPSSPPQVLSAAAAMRPPAVSCAGPSPGPCRAAAAPGSASMA